VDCRARLRAGPMAAASSGSAPSLPRRTSRVPTVADPFSSSDAAPPPPSYC
jgi:hypothetical protein